ncbi:MAG: hypothetical protein ACO3OO_12685 [Gemmobacter sp.]|jgi:hypothetical protein
MTRPEIEAARARKGLPQRANTRARGRAIHGLQARTARAAANWTEEPERPARVVRELIAPFADFSQPDDVEHISLVVIAP